MYSTITNSDDTMKIKLQILELFSSVFATIGFIMLFYESLKIEMLLVLSAIYITIILIMVLLFKSKNNPTIKYMVIILSVNYLIYFLSFMFLKQFMIFNIPIIFLFPFIGLTILTISLLVRIIKL